MKTLKVWPHVTLLAILIAVLAGVGVGYFVKHYQNSSDQTLLRAARIERVDGDVAVSNIGAQVNNGNYTDTQWTAATVNQPFSAGNRIYTRNNAHASLAFTGRNFARLNPNSSLDVLSFTDRRTQLALRDGSAMFDVGYLAPDELFEVATPYGAIDLNQPGLYNVGISNGNVIVSVLSGLAQVVGLGGSGQISKGEVLTLLGQTAADVVLSRVNGRDAGYLINDYYSYRYPNYYDGRYADYNTYLSDPYYFDPYRRNVSYQYVTSYLPGLSDLDYYGDWQNLNGYGYCWHPRVDAGWVPYEQGYWQTDYPYGPTWISTEPWGYAPYHYGRWAFVSNQWYWVPDSATYPVYSPALVAFVPVDQNSIGWVPLGPGDSYVPRYYNSDWQPYYLSRTANVGSNFVNFDVPNAVTVAPLNDFLRADDFRRAQHVDRRSLGNVQAVLDPLTLTPLRNAVIHSAWGRGKIDIPPGIAKKIGDTRVVTSTAPIAPPFSRDLERSMAVEQASNRARNQKFRVRDERGSSEAPANGSGNRGAVQPPTTTDSAGQAEQRSEARQPQFERRGRQSPALQTRSGVILQPRSEVQAERVGRRAQEQVQREVVQPRPQMTPKVRETGPPARVRIERAPVQMQRPPVQQIPRPQQEQRHGPPEVARPQQRSAAPQPVQPHGNQDRRQQGPPPAQQRSAAPQPVQSRGNQERKEQGPPAGNPHSNAGGGKGKGRKP